MIIASEVADAIVQTNAMRSSVLRFFGALTEFSIKFDVRFRVSLLKDRTLAVTQSPRLMLM
jgi:hypothetical protein